MTDAKGRHRGDLVFMHGAKALTAKKSDNK
jgi:hypothetical protein